MTHRRYGRTARLALVAAVAPLFAACSVTDETVGVRPDPSGGAQFRTFMVLGTSISAGFQSAGINDSTQKQGYAYLLAQAMGLTPGGDWIYPAFAMPGCPAPYTNPLLNRRAGQASAAFCGRRASSSFAPVTHNLAIPGLRAAHILDLSDLTFPASDTLRLSQFITGARNPIEWVEAVQPTFVVIEVGANDVLGAATRGDTSLLTPTASFTSTIQSIASRVAAANANVQAVVMGVPNVTVIPYFTRASVLWCLKTGLCTGVPATLPYSLPTFSIDNSCAPALAGGTDGDSTLLSFTATATITSVLSAGGASRINCAADSTTVTTGAGTTSAGPTLNRPETRAVVARAAALNTVAQTEATTRGWAFVDVNAALAAVASSIPSFPAFTNPAALFGTYFSLDGVHPNAAGHRLIAQAFAAAINTKYGTSLTVP